MDIGKEYSLYRKIFVIENGCLASSKDSDDLKDLRCVSPRNTKRSFEESGVSGLIKTDTIKYRKNMRISQIAQEQFFRHMTIFA